MPNELPVRYQLQGGKQAAGQRRDVKAGGERTLQEKVLAMPDWVRSLMGLAMLLICQVALFNDHWTGWW